MFIKTIFDKLKYFPVYIDVLYPLYIEERIAIQFDGIEPTSKPREKRPSWQEETLSDVLTAIITKEHKDQVYTFTADGKDVRCWPVKEYILNAGRHLLPFFLSDGRSVGVLYNELQSGKDSFLTEYVLFWFLVTNHLDGYHYEKFSDVIGQFKLDVLSIFEEYKISNTLMQILSNRRKELVIPIGLVDLGGYLGYIIHVSTWEKARLFIGVNNSGISYRWLYSSSEQRYTFPWSIAFDFNLGEVKRTFPVATFSALLGTIPMESYANKVPIGTAVGRYLRYLATNNSGLGRLALLSMATNFKEFILNTLSDEVINKLKLSKELNYDELDSLSRFLKIALTILLDKPTSDGRLQNNECIDILKTYGARQVRNKWDILEKHGIEKSNRRREIASAFEPHAPVIIDACENQVYAFGLDSKTKNIWTLNLSGVDLAPLRDEVLKLVYNYN